MGTDVETRMLLGYNKFDAEIGKLKVWKRNLDIRLIDIPEA